MKIRLEKTSIEPLVISIIMFVSPVLGIPVLFFFLTKRKKINKLYALPFAMLYGMLGYNMFCKHEPDLVRYLASVENYYAKENLGNILLNDTTFLYSRDIVFSIVGKSGDSYILPMITGFVVYFIVYYVAFDLMNRYQIFNYKYGKTYSFFILIISTGIVCSFYVISNVRCVFAFVIIFFAYYRECIEKKKNFITYFLYAFAAMYHTAAVVLVLARVVVPFIKKCYIQIVIFTAGFPVFLIGTYNFVNLLPDNIVFNLIKSMLSRAYYYMGWGENGYVSVGYREVSEWIEKIYGIPFVLIIIWNCYYISKNVEKGDYYELLKYYYIIAQIALSMLWIEAGAFWRFEAILAMFSSVIVLPLLSKFPRKRFWVHFLFVSGSLMFLYWSMQFFRWIQVEKFIYGVLTMSYFKIF